MSLVAGVDVRHGGLGAVDLGMEPPIDTSAGRHATHDRRAISLRWLSAIVLTGVAGSALIGLTTYAALNGQANRAQAPELATGNRRASPDGDQPVKGDRLVRSADIVAEKQSFRLPTTLKVGDKQIVKMRGYTRVSTTLALAPTGSDDIPAFNPLKLMAGDANPADVQNDEPAVPADDADVSFTTQDLASADASLYGPALSLDEVQAQVGDFSRTPVVTGRIALPPQLLLMRTSRAGQLPTNGLGFADPFAQAVPFSSIEVRIVPENVTSLPRTDASRDAKAPDEHLVVFRHGDVLEDVLRANGATREQARSIVNAFTPRRGEAPVADGRRLKFFYARPDSSKPAQIARLSVYADENLETNVALADNGTYVQVAPANGGQKPRRPAAPSGDDDDGGFRLYDSLYETALKQDLPRPMIDGLVRIFANDVDFQRGVAGGDSFEAFYSDGDDSEGGRQDLLFASITVHNDVFHYYRFVAPDDGTVDYYDENGRSVRKFLMRSPVPNATFTSGFGLRFHPILGYSRPHTGVDWAAPIGTPILAAGSGTVLRAERSPSYGNHVEIQHANGYITTYSHMSGFGRGVVDGARIRQGQVVGFLGQTGLSTGPHLHYEVIVNGHFVDPMRVKLARTREMDGKMLAEFKRERDRIDALMASGATAGPAAVADKRASN